MSAGLIKHLKEKTEQDPNTKILMSQWEFDEKLVGKSLENVGSYYPHFSSHNESHSQQILVNIERLLGDNISKLTATDTWLILEAAYWHDIGMLFSADNVQEVVNNEKFKDYVEDLANNNVQDLHEFAKVWHTQGWKVAIVSYSNPYEGVEKYRQMVAEWYRRGHPDNSHSVVLEPFEKLGINSPRTELLPNRIYRYLAQICLSHGRSFNYVMSELPFRQTGMGTENCHPRFVACMLRLGDLFDIDDNRFCPVMARQVSNMPALSETHKQKHQAIREFQLDNETVSVTAICNTEMSYIECRRWFDWIKEEIQDQMSQWKNIVPSRDFGLLPTINKLDVEMADSKILLDNKPMKFSLDERSAIELLQGNNLYKNDMSVYRELIQNAIDATMIRVWLEHGQKHSQERLSANANPYDEETRKLFAKYPITLDCKKMEDNADATIWEFSIEDNGTGISKKDLEYMQKIAGSKNNRERQKIIREMPEWMRPSGEFGIGLHSAFLLMKDLPTDQQKITIYTKSRLTHESLKIELNSPLSGKAGYCFIEHTEDRGKYGSKLIFNQRILSSEDNQTLKQHSLSEKIKNHTLYVYDKGSLNIILTLISIYRRFSTSLFEIQFSNNIKNIIDTIGFTESKLENFYWDKDQNSGLKIKILDYDDIIDSNGRSSRISTNINVYYRGQFVCSLPYDHLPKVMFPLLGAEIISFDLNICQNRAKNILNLNREKINDEKTVSLIFKNVLNNLIKQASKDINVLSRLFNSSSKFSLFTKLIDIEHYTSLNNSNDWKDFKIGNNFKLEDLSQTESFIVNEKHYDEHGSNKDIIPENTLTIHNQIIEGLLTTKFMKNYLKDCEFKAYHSKRSDSYKWNDFENILFTKKQEIDEHWKPFDFYNEGSEQSKLTFEDLLNYNLMYMSISFSDSPIFIEYNRINESVLDELIKSELAKVIIEIDSKKLFIYPFFVTENQIISIENKLLFETIESYIDIDYEVFDSIYNIIKEYIIELSKSINSEWYDKYLSSKDFKPIDLSPLDKLYKPAE